MLDSGANVLVIPWKPGMKGEKTMFTLVGDNKTEGLIVSKLYTHSQIHLIVVVKEAVVLLPISYLVQWPTIKCCGNFIWTKINSCFP